MKMNIRCQIVEHFVLQNLQQDVGDKVNHGSNTVPLALIQSLFGAACEYQDVSRRDRINNQLNLHSGGAGNTEIGSVNESDGIEESK